MNDKNTRRSALAAGAVLPLAGSNAEASDPQLESIPHGIFFFREGNMWGACRQGFENLQESHAGFGPTIHAALADLLENESESPAGAHRE